MGKKLIIALALLAAVSVACNVRPPAGQATPTAVVQPGPAPAPTQGPSAPSPAPQPTTAPQPAPPAPVPTAASPSKPGPQPTAAPPPSGGVAFCNKTFPQGSVLFPVGKPSDDRYAVVFDPSQSGVAGRDPRGWYYQPCLPPATERQPHELILVIQPGKYDFTGPECNAWLNTRGDDSTAWEKGQTLVSKANVVIDVASTAGRNESWIAVRCGGGAASGFSFSRLN